MTETLDRAGSKDLVVEDKAEEDEDSPKTEAKPESASPDASRAEASPSHADSEGRSSRHAESERPKSAEAKGPAKARSGRVLNFLVEDAEPQRPTLSLPERVKHQWSWRLAAAASSAASMGRPWKSQEPPLPWYAEELIRLCLGTSEVSTQLMALLQQETKKAFMWKDGGHVTRMLCDCADMLSEASAIIEATSAGLTAGPRDALLAMRKRCLPAKLAEPEEPPCLSCTAEEAMALAQSSLARLRGAGAALSLVLRLGTELVVVDEEIRKDFFNVVPFTEMALTHLGSLTKLVSIQLENDLPHVPAEIIAESVFADPSMKSLVGSPSIDSAWEEKEAELGDYALEQDVAEEPIRDESEEPGVEATTSSASAKAANRKSLKKKTMPKVGKKKSGA